jgi:hypothetical protein
MLYNLVSKFKVKTKINLIVAVFFNHCKDKGTEGIHNATSKTKDFCFSFKWPEAIH